MKVASEPVALLSVLTNPGYHFKGIGFEAGPLSQWLFSALAEAGWRVLREQLVILHSRLLAIVRDDEVCRRLMTTRVLVP